MGEGEEKKWRKKKLMEIDVASWLLLSDSISLKELNERDVAMQTASIGCGWTDVSPTANSCEQDNEPSAPTNGGKGTTSDDYQLICRAITQAVSHQLPTAEVRVRA
jgi:hypothetical protein